MADLNVKILLQLIDKASAPARKIRQGLGTVAAEGRRATKSFQLAASLNQASEGVARLADQAKKLLIEPVLKFADFEQAVAEVSTLIDESVLNQAQIAKLAEDAADTFGGPAIDQAKALYQAISAGATTAAKAQAILNESNRLAVAGVTDIETATEALSKTMNAFGLTEADVTDISDSLFAAVKVGITTVPQLSANIGKVAPIAAKAGVSLGEMSAGLATITKTGLSTDEAATALRATFTAILKPSKDTLRAAKDLGIEFSSTALRTKGFAKFLEDVQTAAIPTGKQLATLEKRSARTGESMDDLIKAKTTDNLVKLFPNIRALNGVLALTSAEGRNFAEAMDAQANRAGAAGKAFKTMAETQAFAFKQTRAKLDKLTRALGEGFTPAVNEALNDILPLVKSLTEWIKKNPELVKQLGSVLIKMIAFSAVLRTTMLLVGVLSGARGILGMGSAMGQVGTSASRLGRGFGLLTRAGPWIAVAAVIGNEFGKVLAENSARVREIRGQIDDLKVQGIAARRSVELSQLRGTRAEQVGEAQALLFEAATEITDEQFRQLTERVAELGILAGTQEAAAGSIRAARERREIRLGSLSEKERSKLRGPQPEEIAASEAAAEARITPAERRETLRQEVEAKLQISVKDDRIAIAATSEDIDVTVDSGIRELGT